MEKRDVAKVDREYLHGYLEGISWRVLMAACRHQDHELVKVFHDIQKFIDEAVFGGLRS